MNHSHKHTHCAHTDVKFCSHCNLVFCQNCTQEWKLSPYTWTYTGGTGIYGAQTLGNIQGYAGTPTPTLCKHSE